MTLAEGKPAERPTRCLNLFLFRCCFSCFRLRRDGFARLLPGSFWVMFQGFLKFRLASCLCG